MTKACETFCKHRNNRQPPLFSFPRLPSSFPAIRLAPLISYHLAGSSPIHDLPSHPLLYLMGVLRTEIEEVLWVSHWLPHRSFAQSLGSPFMTASSPPHTLSCLHTLTCHSVNVAHENCWNDHEPHYINITSRCSNDGKQMLASND